jgi:hypothetical protein
MGLAVSGGGPSGMGARGPGQSGSR